MSSRAETQLDAFVSIRRVADLPKGTFFVHDPKDGRGNPACGALRNAWVNGSCQHGWAGGSHILPGQLAKSSEIFLPVKNDGRFT